MVMNWTWERVMAIALGGFLGASTRWLVLEMAGSQGFPWPVLVVNLVGSFALGILLAQEPMGQRARVALHDFGAIGFCGGLTTFSTFTVEIVDLIEQGEAETALVYGLASVIGTIALVVVGAALFRRVRAIDLPLEEAP